MARLNSNHGKEPMHSDDKIGSLLHLYEDGAFDRRELIRRLAGYTGSVAAATAITESAGFAQTSPGCLDSVRVAENDPGILAENVTIHGEGGPLFAYQVIPRASVGKPTPAVIVIHENRGLNDHIKDVTRRVAKAGFVAFGLDLLSRQGGTAAFPDPEQAGAAYNRTRPEERRQDILSALYTLLDQKYVSGKVGALGFCAGGGNVWDAAVNTDRLSAAVAFYGTPLPPTESIANLTAPVLAIYAELDRGTNARLPAIFTALMDQRKTFAIHVYENTNHAFHNDTGARYDPGAACDAWSKTIAFFNRHLNEAAV
jgi:carboxymethylenebutenolidase